MTSRKMVVNTYCDIILRQFIEQIVCDKMIVLIVQKFSSMY